MADGVSDLAWHGTERAKKISRFGKAISKKHKDVEDKVTKT